MNNKSIILSLIALAVLLGAIAFGVSALYKDGGSSHEKVVVPAATNHFTLLPAVPSDAAMVACFQDLGTCTSLLTDSTKVFGAIISGTGNKGFTKFVSSLKESGSLGPVAKSSTIVSIHFSGDLIPLMITDIGRIALDSTSAFPGTLSRMASEAGLVAKTYKTFVMISQSETLVNSSLRHLSEGVSILDAEGFVDAVNSSSSKNVFFLNNDYSGKLIPANMAKRFSPYADFFRKQAKWSELSLTVSKPDHLAMESRLTAGPDPSYYLNVWKGGVTTGTLFQRILPSQTDFAISMSPGPLDNYFENYRKYLDSCNKLDRYSGSDNAARKVLGKTLEKWARDLGIKEVCKAYFHSGDDLVSIVAVRCGNAGKTQIAEGVSENPVRGAFASMFGELFSQEDDGMMTRRGDWVATGSAKALETWKEEHFLDNTLEQYMTDAGIASRIPAKNANWVLYYSLGEDPTLIDNSFRPALASAFRKVISGTTFTPAVISICPDEDSWKLRMDVDRLIVTKSKAPMVERDTTVVVPEGPFKVTNSGTGKTNLFYQNENKYLCLKEETGKGLWGVPFKETICGTAETIDYYGNGKLQFLFGAGSSLYLIDRLGRFVKPFPVNLGKEILIGPAAYDFTGAHGYTAIVLHKDNTIAMYDLHGHKPASWKDITCTETIKALPELLEVKGKKYWVVRTSLQTHIFGFYGGEPLTKGDGDRMIRPDSKLDVNGNGVSATCYDGKTRNIKLT